MKAFRILLPLLLALLLLCACGKTEETANQKNTRDIFGSVDPAHDNVIDFNEIDPSHDNIIDFNGTSVTHPSDTQGVAHQAKDPSTDAPSTETVTDQPTDAPTDTVTSDPTQSTSTKKSTKSDDEFSPIVK